MAVDARREGAREEARRVEAARTRGREVPHRAAAGGGAGRTRAIREAEAVRT